MCPSNFISSSVSEIPENVVKQSYFMNRDKVFDSLPDDSNEVIMLGNSLTQNFEWHEVFKTVNIKNRGIHADNTLGVLNRISEITSSCPKKVFIEIGINDLIKGNSVDSVFSRYSRIINLIETLSPNTKIYIQSLLPSNRVIETTKLPVNPEVLNLNFLLSNFCKKNKIIYIDLFSSFTESNQLKSEFDSGDGLHLNGNGYKMWCSMIETYVQK